MFGRISVTENAELLHGIHREACHLLRPRQADSIGDVAAIEREVLISGATAGDAEHGIVFGSLAGVDHDDSRRQGNKGGRGTIRHRQPRHHLAIHDLTDA